MNLLNNLLLPRNIDYRMICFKKQFLTLLELSSGLLLTLSRVMCPPPRCFDLSTISCPALRLSKGHATTNSVFLNGICSKLALIILIIATISVRCLMSTADDGAGYRNRTGTVSLPRDFHATLCYHSHQ